MSEVLAPTLVRESAEILRGVLREKQRKHPHYSLRAAARDVGVTSGFMSMLLKGKKRLTFKRALEFSQLLRIDEHTSKALLKAVALESTRDSACRAFLEESIGDHSEDARSFAVLELDRFRALSEWCHIAILDLTLIKGFKPDPAWIAEELSITADQVRSAVERLQRLGLLAVHGKTWKKTEAKLAVPTTYSDRAMRDFQEQMIEKAREALQSPAQEDFDARDISGASMAIDPKRLPEAKARIQRFRREMIEFMGQGDCTELYRMNVQFFRLNKKKNRK